MSFRFSRTRIVLFLLVLSALAFPALADNVTISGTVDFAALDGSALDHDHTANGVFTVDDGDLTVLGTIENNDDFGGGGISALPMRFNVSGNMVVAAGAAIRAENQRGGGNGGDLTFTVGGNATVGGTISTSRLTGANPSGTD